MNLSKNKLIEIYSKMDINAWKVLSKIDQCFMCKHKELLYVGDKVKRLNGAYAFHVFSSHGIPEETLADMVIKLITKK